MAGLNALEKRSRLRWFAVLLGGLALLAGLWSTPTPAQAQPRFTIGIGGTEVAEGDSGTTTAHFIVSVIDNQPRTPCDFNDPDLCGPQEEEVCVNFHTVDGTATADQGDYEPVSDGSLCVLVPEGGVEIGDIPVQVNGDTLIEGNETFCVALGTSGATCEANDFTGQTTVLDDDQEPLPTVSISNARVLVEGDDAVFTVTLSEASDEEVTVLYRTQDNTATAPLDYESVFFGLVKFPPGDVSETILVQTLTDEIKDPKERFLVRLARGNGVTIADGLGVGDPPPESCTS
jgi:hypothetical protein